MYRCQLRSDFLKETTNESNIADNKQRNTCVSLLRKAKSDYFANLDTKIMKDNKKFSKTVNPLFSQKSYSKESVKKLSIENVPDDESNLPNLDDPILKAILQNINIRVF